VILGYFGFFAVLLSFFRFWGCLGHFENFSGILIILEVSRIF
jgi:hypothetical protein